VAWTSDGKLLLSDQRSIMRMNTDGSEQTTLVSDPNAWILSISRCGEEHIVVSWAFHDGGNGAHIWRLNNDGTNVKRLTEGKFDVQPSCSNHGKWVYYYDTADRLRPGKRVPLDGGAPEAVPGSDVRNMYGFGVGQTISQDGRTLAFNAEISSPESQAALSKLALVDLGEGAKAPARMIEPQHRMVGGAGGGFFTNLIEFSPDGKSLAYAISDKGAVNIWLQPLDGSAGRQITNFTSDRISEFRWSPDGKKLAVAREHLVSDVVLLQEK
jgi:Tol biopolymer transport system component